MKYIRTKDGKIIKILQEGIDEFGKYGLVDEENCIRNYDDLKQANTIEELCDAFIIVRKDDIRTVSDLKTLKEMLLQRDCDIEFEVEDDYSYIGAIFTNKGIIYKAKMKSVLPSGEIDWELL